jgi:hypothetical protein
MSCPFKIERIPEFDRDLKRLAKKFRSLPEDLEVFLDTALELKHKIQPDWPGIVRIEGLGITSPEIFKARRFACKSLKGSAGNSGIRVIYAYLTDQKKAVLIEMYCKGEKENEDRGRLSKILA